MRISFKAIIIIWIGVILVLGGLFYTAHSKLQPDTFIGLLTEQVQKNYPGASLKVGKVDYKLSIDFNLHLKNVELSRSGKVLGSIGEVELKVPWWLLVVNRGNAQINLSDLQVFIDNDEPDLIKPVITEPGSDKKIKVVLPSYLVEARYTLRAKNIMIRDTKNSRRYLTLSKLLVREFQYGKNSAFELNLPIEMTHKDAFYNSELWLFGDLTPSPEVWKMNYRGEFKNREGSEKFDIENLIIDGSADFKPSALDFVTNVKLMIEKETIGQGRLSATNNDISLNMDFTALPLDFLTIFEKEIQNPYLSTFSGKAQGQVKVTKKRGADITLLNGKLIFDASFPINEKESIPGQWQFSFEDSRWDTSFMSPKGEISYFRRSVIDFKKSGISQYSEELGFNGLEFEKVAPAVLSIEILSGLQKPYFNSSVFYKNCKYENSILNGSFKYGIAPDQVFYQADIEYDAKTMNLAYQNKRPAKALNLLFKNFKINNSFKFLVPYFSADSAILDGKLEGRWSTEWHAGDWLIQSRLSSLDKPQGKVVELIKKIGKLFNLEPAADVSFNGQIKNQSLEVTSLVYEGQDPAKISGNLKSSLALTYPKNKKWKPVKKESSQLDWKE